MIEVTAPKSTERDIHKTRKTRLPQLETSKTTFSIFLWSKNHNSKFFEYAEGQYCENFYQKSGPYASKKNYPL